MKIGCTLIAVADMERSKRFYREVLGLPVTGDFGANVILGDNELSMQTAETWVNFIGGCPVSFGGNTFELYFEEADIDGFVKRLASMPDVEYVHPLIEHTWGQRALRLFDPDRHIIEVAENLSTVIDRFLTSGMTAEETARRMDVPVEYIISRMSK